MDIGSMLSPCPALVEMKPDSHAWRGEVQTGSAHRYAQLESRLLAQAGIEILALDAWWRK
jgi:hypothetical protein